MANALRILSIRRGIIGREIVECVKRVFAEILNAETAKSKALEGGNMTNDSVNDAKKSGTVNCAAGTNCSVNHVSRKKQVLDECGLEGMILKDRQQWCEYATI